MKPTKFMPAEDKEKVLKSWQRFINSGFDKKYFTKRLYDHLNLHCSFIAHFNQQGFYSSYFEDPEQTIEFLKQFDTDHACVSVEYSSTHWLKSEEYRDLNTAMVKSLEPYKAGLYESLKQKAREMKLAQIEKLKREIEEIEKD